MERNKCCPICKSKLLCRENDNIICLSCDWKIESKRGEDKEIKEVHEVIDDWR